MRLDLEVLASTAIKRKKPWPRTIWIGEEQESLLLLDAPGKRVSVLYVPSGKTKRRLPKVSPLAEQAICFASTRNGRYLVGLLSNGELFIWHKDKDVVKFIPGLEKMDNNLATEKCHIDASDDCSHVLVAVGHQSFYIWAMERGETIHREQVPALKGSWHRVTVPAGMELPTDQNRECSMASVFYESLSLGYCCQCSLVFNEEAMLCVATLVLKFPDHTLSFSHSLPIFSAEWSLLEYPFPQMHPDFEPVPTPGAYVSTYSGSGQVLAVAANQRSPAKTTMLFVSPLTDTVLVGGMKNCGVSDLSKTGRQYWVCDLAWTSDNLFLACMLRNGSVCLIPRLGDPIAIETRGCSVDMGPALFLPLHPAIMVSGNAQSLEPSAAEQDPLQQTFSVATHPSLPIVLFSDGFLVTVAQLPVEVTAVTMMRGLVLESAKHLKKLSQQEDLDMTVADAYRLSKGQRGSKQNLAQGNSRGKRRNQYEFEMAEISLNATHDSDVSILDTTNKMGFDQFGAIGNMESGKIVFGEPEMIAIDPNATFTGLEASESLLKYLEESMSALTQVWKLGASYSDIWSAEVDNIVKQAVHNFYKIFSVVLDCPAVDAIMPILTPRQSSAIQNPRVYNIIVAYRNILQLLRFDTFNQHLIPAALRLIHKTIQLMLTSKELENTDPRLKTLFGCFSLLKHAETSLNRIYVWVPSDSQNGTPVSGSPRRFEPAVMMKGNQQSPGSSTDVHGGRLQNKGQFPGKRLAATWKLLYKHVMEHQAHISRAGDCSGDLVHVDKLLASIQHVLHDGEGEVTPRSAATKLSAGEKLSVDGEHDLALEAWKEQLKMYGGKKDNPKTARMLHSVLYTFLLRDELAQAVDFIDGMILQASVDMAMSSRELPTYEDGSRPPLMTLVTHRSQDSEEEELVPCIKNKSIRQTVQTMARFMAAYFSNQTMYIYPPHSAQPLSSVHLSSVPTKSRIIPKYHEEITQVITRENLSSLWTTERTVEYLLLSGLICETAWFAHKMGDWKTGYLLSVSHTSHREIAPQLYRKPKKPLKLSDNLWPHSILQEKLEILIKSNRADSAPTAFGKHHSRYFIPINQETNIPQLTRTLGDILTAGIVSDVELAPWLLTSLLEKLKSVVSNLSPLVPEGFYLPAPPLFCPQPGEVEMTGEQPDVQYEHEIRMEMSSIIQLILVALNSANLALPTGRWYIQDLFKMQEKAAQFKATTEGPCLELPEILQQYKIFRSELVDLRDLPSVHFVMCAFRDFCTLLWLLHVRDELSVHLRKRGSHLNDEKQGGEDTPISTLGHEYIQECFKILKWAVHLLSFSHYIADDGCIRKVILSLILELPATEDTADILAEHFYAPETFDPEVQEKLERLVSTWQSVEIVPEDDGKSARLDENVELRQSVDSDDVDDDGSVRKSVTFFQASPRAKTLSVYFHKQCDVVRKVMKKKRKIYGQYDEFVFDNELENDNTENGGARLKDDICIGSRSFETKQSYLEFLDRFYAICFTKVVENESESGRTKIHPILMPFAKVIREYEFETFLTKNEESYQKKPSSVVMASPRAKFFRSQSESQVSDTKDSPATPQRKSLFRSNSSSTVDSPKAGMSRFVSEGSLFGRNRPQVSPSRVKPNMTGMASRFFQSEDVLYRDAADREDIHWIMDVNFGQRYLALQHLLDYLHHWAGKQHLLGLHGKSDKEIGLKPTMRIEVPTQLVVLGLWLLENKYSPGKGKKDEEKEEQIYAEIEDQVDKTPRTPRDNTKQKPLTTVEELTEHDSFTQVSNIPRSRSHSPGDQRLRAHSPRAERSQRSMSAGFDVSKDRGAHDRTLDYVRSITSTQEETEQMKTAYKKVLDDYNHSHLGDDSSSLEVSSLEEEGYGQNLKQSNSPSRRSRAGTKSLGGSRGVESSPESKNNSAFNNTLQFEGSPDRASGKPPQTSTPLTGNSPSRRQGRKQDGLQSADVSHISLPPTGFTAQPRPEHYRSGLLGGDLAQTAPPITGVQHGADNPVNMAGMDLAQQLQAIVRGELRRMMEVQHQSMMAMMGALDGDQPPAAMQPAVLTNQRAARSLSPQRGDNQENEIERRATKGNRSMRGVLGELHNLQQTEEKQQKKKRPKSPHGKENVDSPLRVSELRSGENVEVYRVTQNEQGPNFYPNFLRIPAERDKESVRFPQIPRQAWTSQNIFPPPSQGPVEMPLLQVDRTVPAHKFPVSQRSQSLPRYLPDAGFFQAPPSQGPVGSLQGQAPYRPPQRPADSPDSGIGIPLLKLQNQEERKGRAPRFGELLPPDQVIESMEEAEQKERLRERYLREFHQLQSEKATDDYKRLFGEKLLHLDLERAQKEDRVSSPRKAQTPRATPRKSPRKTPRSMSEHVSSKSSKKSKKKLDREDEEKDEDTDQQISDQLSDKQPISERLSSRHSARHPIGEEESGEGEESLDEDATEAESVTEEEGPLHDGYAMKKGEFEAYLALENALMKTKDTSARIQLKTAIRLQRQRMMENWKRPKVDFSTNTAEQLDMGTDAEDIAPEPGYFRYSEKATSITKDTGVDPIHEAVIEYNQSRQPNVLPPDIYMGLRFNEHGQQPGSDITGQQQDSRGRNYLNVVDLDASAILHDLRERPEPGEPQLDVSMSPQQMRLRNRMADESVTRVSFEPPAVERPTRADELTVRMFDTSVQGEDRVTLAVMPRDSMPDSKYAIMQRLRDMNSQLAAIDQMSNNIEREFKSTRLAIHTLEEVTHAMEAAPKHASVDFEDQFPERLVESRAESRSDTGTLTPQRSAKSPTPSVRVTARSTARSRKSTKEDRKELSTELAKLSGLSGISDIIGDMVAQGEINLDDVGLSRREADRLVQRGIIRQEQAEDARMSLDSIKKMADTAGREGSRNKEELRQWTAQKRHKLTEEYRRHVEELREREIRPFRPAHDTTFDQSMTLNDHKAREDSRKVSRQANMSRRMDEAQHLLGDILTEKPNLPPDIPTREVSPKRRPNKDRSPISVRDRTPVRKPASVKRDVTPTRAKKGILKTRDVSPPFMPDFSQAMEGYDSYELDLEYDQQVPDQAPWQPEPREIIAPPPRAEERPIKGQGKVPSVMKVPGVVPKLKLGLEDVDEEEPLRLQQTGDTSGDLTEYCRAMQDMDVSISQDASREAPKHAPTRIEQPPSPTPSPQKTYKVKPFTEIVRLQRPERTRKQPDKLAMEYVARQRTASRMDSSRSSVRTELTQRDREMIHGSKRLPQKKPTETGPRRVKTYAERLQEMKSGEKYSTPVAPKSQYGSSIASTSARPTSRPVRPKHKPMTYVEQLQKLNEGHHKPRVGMETTVIRKPMIRSHKPPHKAKTYAQQLQELQPTKTFTGPPSKRMHKQTGARQRPYKDPYTPVGPEDFDQLEAASVVSGWSMSDDVRHILYNDVDSSIAVGQSASYAPSEQISDYYDVVMDNDRMEDDYTASVDIDDLVQIADQGSVSSGSMMSFIDWDQVDDLINDVR
ncbi:ciliogenesis and planar polarity effector 1-like isoform X4 [Mya arenaria]|uniref:ciliogenesis and planar polarity effector 1-like isoform X4 n=1 Tax=Mya arenaria TaxID=6604 RepID=UPI0022E37C3D|nr:ciliogenesis and planar polarity effector 1-like isoform X4 [Mya arenaria]